MGMIVSYIMPAQSSRRSRWDQPPADMAAQRRDRSESPRRDRYDDSRSRSRDRYRSNHRARSPANGHYDSERYSDRRSGPPARTHEERAQHKAEMVQNIKEESIQENRVYVGNLPYDVKWGTLKDYMAQGKFPSLSATSTCVLTIFQPATSNSPTYYYFRTE
jgi:hypothetical protein